ncbi:inorganic phosphate transporter [Mycobacterium tuberculosis]
MAAGTYLGGWRIIRTLGKGLVEIKPPQGMAAESSSAAVILLSATSAMRCPQRRSSTGSCVGSGAALGARCLGSRPHGGRVAGDALPAGWSGPSPTGWCISSVGYPADPVLHCCG